MADEETYIPLSCDAPHPAAEKFPRFKGKTHGALLPVRLPGWMKPVRVRQLETLDQVRPGYMGVQCTFKDCGAVHEFRVDVAEKVQVPA